ncbi:thiamine pyrophosphate-binding protein [Novosphingobium resinovorum]|uniref:thiamine pyrophosphate-binding protein n=1 Tax=Novosphingobium resinovorum TaxID=158500 RepID=UPI002ED1649C|nr:thiamine pyrophosphate-binding protein [Novosphingobium resinovorum]
MANITGGAAVARTLKNAGVEAVFGVHGAHIDTIFQALHDLGQPVIDTRHEVAGGHAAEGYARTSRSLGVALLTAGGGFTNGLTSIANAWLDRTPVLYIAGSGPMRDDETNTLQAGIDQVAMATPVTKWAHRVLSAEHLPRLISQAIRIATSAPFGPVLLDIPWDVLTCEIDEDILKTAGPLSALPPSRPAPSEVADVLDLLDRAQRPVIIVGSEASRSDTRGALRAFATKTGIPVFSDYEGLNLLSHLPPDLHGGLIQGLFGLDRKGQQPDCVLMLGLRFGLSTVHGSGQLIPHSADIIQVDPDARELGRLQHVNLPIRTDVAGMLEALAEATATRDGIARTVWQNVVRKHLEDRACAVAAAAMPAETLHPFTAAKLVAEHVGPDVAVVADGALTYHWLSEAISAARPGAFLCHGYFGSMGVGFGVAVGSQVAAGKTGGRTVLVTGDGAVGFSLAEFDTLVRHGLPTIVIVMNNRAWGATLHFQQLVVGADRVTNTRLENGSYSAVAAALGADHYEADSAETLAQALRTAFQAKRPACIDVRVALDPIPPEENILMGKPPFPVEDTVD